MEITKLIGQTQTEEQRQKEKAETAKLIQEFSKNASLTCLAQNNFKKLMFNPAKEAEKALIGASSYAHLLKYVLPTKEEREQEELIISLNKGRQSFQETQERMERARENHKQMLIDVQVEAMRKFEAEKQQVNVDAGTVSHSGTGTKPKALSKMEKQQAAILETINAKEFKPMAIPDGEKGTLKDICEKENKNKLFNASSAFDAAWKKGIGKLWQMEHHESYAHRGNN